jgi:hypothetical protein
MHQDLNVVNDDGASVLSRIEITPPDSPRLPSVDTEVATCQQSLSAVKKEAPRKSTYRSINATSETFQTVEEKSDVMRDEE